jgi:asparaginyl-tRNA synthetase
MDFAPTTLIKNLKESQIGSQVTIGGWLRTRRDSKGGFSFLEINDGSQFKGIQVVADQDLDNYAEIAKTYTGASLKVEGELVSSPGEGQAFEIKATAVEIFCNTDQNYVLQKGRVSLEKLREVAHLRGRTNAIGATMRVRNQLAKATHDFFTSNDFLYLHTPIITSSDCEGAGQMFQVSTLNLENLPKDDKGRVDYDQDFFGRKTHLTVSGQLNGEAYACGMGRIYTFGPTFRAENSNTSRHLAEFWMVEPEAAFFTLSENAQLAAAYLRYCFKHVLDTCQDDIDFFNLRVDTGLRARLEGLIDVEYKRITYTEAVDLLVKADKKFEFPVIWGADLQSEHERYLCEEVFKGPVTVTDYPKQIKAFYMKLNDDGKTVRAMDVLCPQIGEIIGGAEREDRLDVLETRMALHDLNPDDYSWFLDLRRYGSVPHAGFGLGFERLVQFCTGMSNIRDVIPFPRTPRNASF